MSMRLIAVPDVVMTEGTVQRGIQPEPKPECLRVNRQIDRQISSALQQGWMTVDEARVLLGWPKT